MACFGDGYRWFVSGIIHDDTGFPVTNVQNVTETTSVNVQKAWVDGGNTDGRTAVTIQLTRLNASGEFEDVDGKTIELTDGNWANSFTDLPKYEAVYSTTANEDGSYDVTDYAEITYGVREDTQVSGYDAGYVTGDMTHDPVFVIMTWRSLLLAGFHIPQKPAFIEICGEQNGKSRATHKIFPQVAPQIK